MVSRLAVIMAGGSGERFWPVSTPERPKQLLRLTHPTMNMLEEAMSRISPTVGSENVYVSTSAALLDPISEIAVVSTDHVLAEPAKRNTLGALIWVAASLAHRGLGESTVAILTADHKIDDPEKFRETVETAFWAAETLDSLVTIGVQPTRPETGFGYLEADLAAAVDAPKGAKCYSIKRFREKPSLATAKEFILDPSFSWNAGMFFFKLPVFLEALQTCQPGAFKSYGEILDAFKRANVADASRAFESIPSISVDFAVMEKAPRVHMVPAGFPWDDVGSWDALERSIEPDAQGNVVQGSVAMIESSNCIIINDNPDVKIGVLRLNDMLIVNTSKAIFACPKDLAQRVKEIAHAIRDLAD